MKIVILSDCANERAHIYLHSTILDGVYMNQGLDRCINEFDPAPICSVATFGKQRCCSMYTALVECLQPIVDACDEDDLTNDIVSNNDSVCQALAGTTPAPTEAPGLNCLCT